MNNVTIWTKNGELNLARPNRHMSTSLTRELTKFQSPSMTCTFSPPIQQSTSTPNFAGVNMSRRKLRNVISNSEKFTDSLEDTPGSQQTVEYSRINRLYDQYRHMESSYGDAQRRTTPKKYTDSRIIYCAALLMRQNTCK